MSMLQKIAQVCGILVIPALILIPHLSCLSGRLNPVTGSGSADDINWHDLINLHIFDAIIFGQCTPGNFISFKIFLTCIQN